MGGRSPIFLIAAVLLLAVNVGLGYAVVHQRDEAALTRDEALLKGQLAQLTERLEVAKAIDATLPTLSAELARLQSQFRAVEPSLYTPDRQSAVEARLSQLATSARGRGPAMTVDRIDVRITDERPPLREHTFNVHLRGKLTLLPAMADEFYQDPSLALISRYAAVSPDMRFQDLDMVLRVHYYQADFTKLDMPKEELILSPFEATVALTDTAEVDPRLVELRTQVAEARGALTALRPKLLQAAELEAKIKQYEKVSKQVEELRIRREQAETLARENLPKLYLRIRNSPLGGAALAIEGGAATFPNYGGDE